MDLRLYNVIKAKDLINTTIHANIVVFDCSPQRELADITFWEQSFALLTQANIRIKNVHACQLVARMVLCMCVCLDACASVFLICTCTWSHTWMYLFMDGWMHFARFYTHTDRTGAVWKAAVHAATPQLTTSIITSSGCRSANVRPASAPLDVCQSFSKKRWEVRTKQRKRIQRETRWKCFECQAQAVWYNSNLNPSKKERRKKREVILQWPWNYRFHEKQAVKKAKPSSVFLQSWSLRIAVAEVFIFELHFLPKTIFTPSAKQSWKLAFLSRLTGNPVGAIDNQISLWVTVLLRMINGVRHRGSRQPCTCGDWYVDCLACSVRHHFRLLVPWLMAPGDQGQHRDVWPPQRASEGRRLMRLNKPVPASLLWSLTCRFINGRG